MFGISKVTKTNAHALQYPNWMGRIAVEVYSI